MLFTSLLSGGVALALASTAVAVPNKPSYSPSSTDKTDVLAKQALATLKEYAASNPNPSTTCTFQTAAKRREWGSLCKSERRAYIKAVKCLMSKPSRLDPALVPGAKSRYDDFVAVHMNQTFTIHATANFLSWHRLFTWSYEQALRNECGYHGYQPYWNWGRWALDPLNSPLFDGSDTSLSGNGVYAEHNCTNALPTNLNCIPPGAGGGCVNSGPFADMSVNLGPLAPTLTVAGIPAPDGFFGHNPRCLRRDISSWVSSNWTTDHETWDLIANHGSTIETFQNRMQGDFATGYYGVHSAGHYTLNGDPSGDFFVSPGDPAFWLHHGQIDRVWWIWQNLDPEARTKAIGGTITLFNDPPSREGRLDDWLDMGGGVLTDGMVIEEAMSTLGMTGGPFCYVYV